MEQISKVRKCYFCGATLQSDDPTKEGYIDPETLSKPGINFLFCNHCFEIERYRSTSNEPMINDALFNVIDDAKARNCLIVYVVNLFSFETSFVKHLIEHLKDAKIMVVGTKFDTLPKGTDRSKIQEYVAHRFRVAGLQITSNDVSIVSKNEKDTINDVLTKIFELKDNKDVYVIGSEEAGKTSLIEGFLKIYKNISGETIKTHNYKNTNLKVMEIPLTAKSSMYETPGISITNSILFGLDTLTLKKIMHKEPITPRVMSVSVGHSLFIGGLAVVELEKGPKTDVICYFHKNVELTKNHIHDIEGKFIKLNKKKELIPSHSKIKSTKDMEVFEIEMQDGDGRYRDIGIAGLGWISMRSMNQTIRIYLPKGVSLYTSRPKIEVK